MMLLALRDGRRMRLALVFTVLLTVAAMAATVPPVAAQTSAVTAATLRWAVSPYVTTSTSMTPERTALAPASVDAEAWTFGTGTGTADLTTGAVSLAFAGGIEFGNVVQGNYGFLLTDLKITVEPGGAGRLTADVATRGPGGPGPKTTFGPATDDVVVATFFAGTPVTMNATSTWTVQPITEPVPVNPAFPGALQFPASFMSVISPGLQGHFRQTGADGPAAAANVAKLPSPIIFSVTASAATTAVTTTTSAPATAAPATNAPATTTPATTTPATTTTTAAPATAASPTTTAAAPAATGAAPTLPGIAAGSAGRPISGGSLEWGVKATFRRYVEFGPAAGRVEVGSPASRTERGFRFDAADGGTTTGTAVDARFAGSIRFVGHGDQLDLTFSNPRVRIDGSRGVLVVDARSRGLGGGAFETLNGVELAVLELGPAQTISSTAAQWTSTSATLTAAGARAFGGFYQAGESLDPLTITVDTAASVPTEVAAVTEAAVTEASLDRAPASLPVTGGASVPLLGVACVMVAAGAVVLMTVRRRGGV